MEEKNKIEPLQALNVIYSATRKSPLSADEHDYVKECAVVLQEALTPKAEEVIEGKKKK